ncbi:MAG: hypothetical protein JXR96_05760 [Deltaproteobacteria bacterium]|nr:hypothetical protein [Deltaproteobacteria bacterium]
MRWEMTGRLGAVCLWTVACGSSSSPDLCRDVVCDEPPKAHCADASSLVEYDPAGSCDPATGECAYGSQERDCEHGCEAGRCQDPDLCIGVICDSPPDNSCADASSLRIYEAVGSCDPLTGDCEYDFELRDCEHGCEGGWCTDQDLCAGVVCESPPPDICADDRTLLVYEQVGMCDPETGRCVYEAEAQACEHGCEHGRCKPGQEAWGWLSAVEIDDAGGPPGVAAYFAVEPHYRRSLLHQAAIFCTQLAAEGACVLFSAGGGRPGKLDPCMPPCNADQECVVEGEDFVCRDLPAHFDVGTISITGMKVACEMQPDEYDRYVAEGLPDDLFDDGDAIEISATGGELEPFVFSAPGTAHLEIDSAQVLLERDQPSVISWTPADPDSRVQVVLLTGLHDPSLPSAGLMCDAPDGDGRVEIPASLVNGFLDRHFVCQKFSRITRYTHDLQSPFGREIEFVVGSAHALELVTP